jgi:hypothetical protein
MALVLLLLLVFVSFSAPVKAQTPDIYYERAELIYSINPDWSIDVQMEFTLVNDSKLQKITSVSRGIPSSSLQNVNVYDNGGNPLSHTEDELDDQTTIKVYFDDGVGPGDRLTYFITFTAPDLLTERGPKHEAWLGGLKLGPDDSRYDEYVVEVQAPPGVRLFLCQPPSARLDNGDIRYDTQLIPPQDFGGVYGVWYPETTYYGLTLVEELTNPGPGTARDIQLDIELFNHTVWQFAAVTGSSVLLGTMYVDEDNNWHGVFEVEKLEPGQSENVQIDLVLLNSTFESGANENNTGLLSDVPGELEPYLHEDEYWEVDNQLIQQRAQEVVGDEYNAYLVAKEIVGFVDDHLNYKVTAERKGAVETLTSGEGDCDCFSDLTIALSRAVGLPARLDMGSTYDGDELGGHAWVEFYLPNHGWVPADPLWVQNSGDYIGRLDPVHVLRGVRGLRSGGGHVQFTYRGAKPSANEHMSATMLSESEAAGEFVSAAENAVNIARELLEGNGGNLAQELALAENYLQQARGSGVASQKLTFSQEALRHANAVIRALGEPPEESLQFDLLGPLLLGIAAALAIVGAVAGVWRYVRKK